MKKIAFTCLLLFSIIAHAAMHIIMVDGQSNAEGMGVLPCNTYSHISQIENWSGGAWIPAVEPLVSGGGCGFAMEFANRLAAQYPGDTIGIVNRAVGGTYVQTWRPQWTSTNYYGIAVNDTFDALNAAPSGSKISCLLWAQGEQDSVVSAVPTPPLEPLYAPYSYIGRTTNIFQNIRAVTNTPYLPIAMWELGNFTPGGSYNASDWANLRLFQSYFKMANLAVINTDPPSISYIGVHATTASYVIIGDRMADALLPMIIANGG